MGECEFCRQNPHDCRCPNAPEVKIKCLCWNCNKEIYEDEPVLEIDGELWCSQCSEETNYE